MGKKLGWIAAAIVLVGAVTWIIGVGRPVCFGLCVLSAPLIVIGQMLYLHALTLAGGMSYVVALGMSGWMTDADVPEAPLLTMSEVTTVCLVSVALAFGVYLILRAQGHTLTHGYFAEVEEDEYDYPYDSYDCELWGDPDYDDYLNQANPDLAAPANDGGSTPDQSAEVVSFDEVRRRARANNVPLVNSRRK